MIQTGLRLLRTEEGDVGYAAYGVARRPERIAGENGIALIRCDEQSLQPDRMARQKQCAHSWKQLLLLVSEWHDMHVFEHRVHVRRRAPVAGTRRARIFEFELRRQDLGIREEIEVLHMIPMQMGEEYRIDVVRRQPVTRQRIEQQRPDAERSRVEQDRALLVSQQKQRTDAEEKLIGLRRQAGHQEIDFHSGSAIQAPVLRTRPLIAITHCEINYEFLEGAMRNGFRLMLAGLLCSALSTGSVALAQGAKAPAPVRAAYIPVVTWLPAWVAKEKGFFAAHGLDVTLSPAQNLSVLPGTVGRQFDFAPSTAPDLLKAAGSGLDVVAVAASVFETEDNPSTQLIVTKESGIASAKDLVGKLVATPTLGGVIHVSVLYWLKKNGVDPTSVRAVEVPFPAMADQLKAKRVDAVEAVEPFAGALRNAGNVVLTDPLLSAGKEVLFPFWIAQGEWARSHRDVIGAWKASLDDAIAFIKANPDEARKIVAQYSKLPEAVVKATPFPTYRTEITAKDIGVWGDVMREIGQLPSPVDPGKLVVTP